MTEKKLWKKLGYEFVPISIIGQVKGLTEAKNKLPMITREDYIKHGKLIGEINVLLDKLSRSIR